MKGSRFSDELADGTEEDNLKVEDDNDDDLANEQYVQLDDDSEEGYGSQHPSPSWNTIQSLVAQKKSMDYLY